MSLAFGVVSSSKSMGHEKNNEGEEHCEPSKTKTTAKDVENAHEHEHEHERQKGGILRQMSESSIYGTEDEEDEKIELGPQYTLKEQFEKDKVCFCICLSFTDKDIKFLFLGLFDYDLCVSSPVLWFYMSILG